MVVPAILTPVVGFIVLNLFIFVKNPRLRGRNDYYQLFFGFLEMTATYVFGLCTINKIPAKALGPTIDP